MQHTKNISVLMFFGFITLSAISAFYVSLENNVYYWDYLTYFNRATKLNALYHGHPFKAIGKIFSSVWKSDYNYLPSIILSFSIELTQNHRQSYIQTILLFYFMPFAALFVAIFSKITRVSHWKDLLLPSMLVFTNMALIGPLLRGFPDVGGMIFIECAILLAMVNDYSESISVKKSIQLGAVLWGAFLFRRWYAYTVVALYVSLPIFNYFHFNSKIYYKRLLNTAKSFLISGVSSIVFVLVFQFGLLLKILRTDYSVAYSAYQKPMMVSINAIFGAFGLYLVPFLALGVLFLIREKDKRLVLSLAFCLFNLIFSAFLFLRTQSPGIQHIIPFSFWMLMLAAYGAMRLFHSFRWGSVFQVVFCIILPTVLLVALFCDRPYQIPFLREMLPLRLAPITTENFQIYQQLVDDLEHVYKPQGSVAILSSSFVLNESIVENVSNYRLVTEDVAHVDLRDHFKSTLLNARYVVVVSPVQTHLALSDQRVITVPAYEILNGEGVGKNYKKVGRSYELKPGIYAYIYEKTEPFSADEIACLNGELYKYYPDWKAKGFGYTDK